MRNTKSLIVLILKLLLSPIIFTNKCKHYGGAVRKTFKMRENDPAASSSSISCGPDANAAGGYALTMYLKLSKTPVDSNTPIHIMKLGDYLSVTAYRIPNDLKKANV
jgi:hypothetical protein